MRKILICFSYKGTNYCGYQKQLNVKNTIEEVLEKALNDLTQENIKIVASGRTDAGVHAIKQYASFCCENNIPTNKLPIALNAFLPTDIRVLNAKEVDFNFDARKSAKSKTYIYVFYKGQKLNPFIYDLVANLKYNLDYKKIDKCLNVLKGEHNFKAFCSSGTGAKTFNRTIFDLSYKNTDEYLVFKIKGNGFLYNMVRIIIGTIIDISRGLLDESCLENMFKTGDRKLGGQTASEKGLYLFDVEY